MEIEDKIYNDVARVLNEYSNKTSIEVIVAVLERVKVRCMVEHGWFDSNEK